ncbi:MAG: hypothetical protein V3S83_08665 [Gemmatimonadota bacterium]
MSLVEAIVSLILLATGILGMAALAGVSGSQVHHAQVATRLQELGGSQMESILAGGHDRLTSGSRRSGDYYVEWRVSGDGSKDVLVIVGHDGGRANFADTLSTIVSLPL